MYRKQIPNTGNLDTHTYTTHQAGKSSVTWILGWKKQNKLKMFACQTKDEESIIMKMTGKLRFTKYKI